MCVIDFSFLIITCHTEKYILYVKKNLVSYYFNGGGYTIVQSPNYNFMDKYVELIDSDISNSLKKCKTI